MSKMILASFSDDRDADRAVSELESEGFDPSQISLITQKTDGSDDASEKDSNVVAEGAATGAGTGAAVGGLAGLLAGAGLIPAITGLLIGGPIAAALGATGVVATAISGAATGAVAGGLIGAVTNLGVSEEIARSYDEVVQSGGIILGVPIGKSGEHTAKAESILTSNNAKDITEVSGWDS